MRIPELYLGNVVPLALAAMLAAGCTEREVPTEPDEATVADESAQRSVIASMQCTANVAEETLSCGEPSAVPPGLDPRFLIVGGQGTFVTLTSSNVDYDAGTGIFSADVTVRNLIGQQLGTPDEIAFTHVRVFFHSGPNVISGPGPVTVANADGTGDFTGSDQPFHEYFGIIHPGSTANPENWQFNAQVDVVFEFEVFVEADVPHPNGYVQVTPRFAALGIGEQVTIGATIRDVVGRSVSGTVTFASADENIATVDANTGVVTAVAGGSVEIIASSDGVEDDGIARITVPVAGYQIELRYLTAVTASQQAAFESARDRWEAIITGDLSEVTIDNPFNAQCLAGPIDEIVDDIVIRVILAPIDGPGNILGSAGPCILRHPSDHPVFGFMRFDTADLDALETNNQLEDVILHEIGHVIGFGTVWHLQDLLLDTGGDEANCAGLLDDPFFAGPEAIAAFDAAGGTDYPDNKVPVEDTGPSGTVCGHWRESVHDNELMSGFSEASGIPMPLSAITIESLEDLGYSVDPNEADPYMLPGGAAPATVGGLRLIDDIWLGPVFSVDQHGNMIQVLPDRRPQWQRRLDELWRR